MFFSYDTSNKSTKGASKMRRDHINHEINKLRDLLPIPASARQRLSQLQLMALILVYVRKTNYFEKRESFYFLLKRLFILRANWGKKSQIRIEQQSNDFSAWTRLSEKYYVLQLYISFLRRQLPYRSTKMKVNLMLDFSSALSNIFVIFACSSWLRNGCL